MQKPLIIGMGPNKDYPSLAWHPNAVSTANLCFLAFGKWAALDDLEKHFNLRNLNNSYYKVGGSDEVNPTEAPRALYDWLKTGALSERRDVVLLGKAVTHFVSHYLLCSDLRFAPLSSFDIKGKIQDASTLDNRLPYHFTAHVLWHPARFARCKNSTYQDKTQAENVRDRPMTDDQAAGCRRVLARLAKLDETTMPPVTGYPPGEGRLGVSLRPP